MKKLLCSLFAAVFMLVSCTGVDYSDINNKIESRQELTQSDYKAMIEYIADVKSDFPDITPSEENADAIHRKYPYFSNFYSALLIASLNGNLDDDNKSLISSLQ